MPQLQVDKFPTKKVSKYKDIRGRLKDGDILLCSGSGAFSKMIQKATGSVWSHVAFVMYLEAIDRMMVLESVEPLGVRTVPLSSYLKDYNASRKSYPGGLVIARHTDFSKQTNKKALKELGQFAVQLFGYPYDKDEIAKIALRIMSSHLPFSKDEKKELKPDREYICSEYVWECYKKIGVKIQPDKRGFIAPADYADLELNPEMQLKYVLKR